MPLSLFPLQDQGMAQLAGMRASTLNLPLHGTDASLFTAPILDAQKTKFAANQQLLNTQAQGQNALAVTQQQGTNALNTQGLANTGNMNVIQAQGQNQLADTSLRNAGTMAQQQLQNQGQLQNTQLSGQNQLQNTQLQGQNQLANTQLSNQPQMAQAAAMQQNADTESKKAQQEIALQHMQMQFATNDYQRNMQNKVGTVGLIMAQQYANDPAKLSAGINSLAENSLQNGYINQEQHDSMIANASNPDAIRNAALTQILMGGTASTAKDAGLGASDVLGSLGSSGGSSGGSGNSLIPPGFLGNMYGNANADSKAAVAQLTNSGQTAMNTQKMLSDYNPDFFNGESQVQGKLGAMAEKYPTVANWAVNHGFVNQGTLNQGSTFDAASAAYQDENLQSNISLLNGMGIHRLSPETMDVLKASTPSLEDSPSAAYAKTVTNYQRNNRSIAYAQQLINKGLDKTNPDQFDQMVNQNIQNDTAPGQLTFTIPNGPNKGLKQPMGYNDVAQLAQAKGWTFQQANQYVIQHP